MLNRTNIFLSVVLVATVLLVASSRVDYSQPNIEILPDIMKYTPAATAYAENDVFANGRTLQAPIAGTIARGDTPLRYEATEEDAIRAGLELANPIGARKTAGENDAAFSQSLSRGSTDYRVFCISCHGATGAGDGPVPKRGFPPPPSLLTGKSIQMKDGQLFHILTYGQGSMPGFAGQLSVRRRRDLVNYVRSLQPTQISEEARDEEAGANKPGSEEKEKNDDP